MVEDRIRNIESRVQSSTDLPPALKAELQQLLADMRAELANVQKEHLDRAESAAGPAAHGESMGEALGGLTGAIEQLEATHPQLAALTNRVAIILSNMGI
jgi:hypothetical protein